MNATYHLKIKEWPEQERPREKMLSHGPRFLSDAELLAILIGSGTRNATALDIAKKMLVDHGGLLGIADKNVKEITRLKGIGSARGARLLAAFEIGRRIETAGHDKQKFHCAQDVVQYYSPKMRHLKYEVFKAMLLDNGNKLIKDVEITKGTLNASLVHPREVFKEAIDHLAAGVIVVHNHPSGNITPSKEDITVSDQLKKAGEIVGIPVIDHLIVGGDQYYSFADQGFFNSKNQ